MTETTGADRAIPGFPDGGAGGKLGPDRELNGIDVATQQERDPWTLRQFAYYFKHPLVRRRIVNVISLEFSGTALAARIRRPSVVEAMDLVTLAWPFASSRHSADAYPKVQLYALMSVAQSYTDFHIDFGGSSVFYHVVSGEKLFYFIRPTPENLRRYQEWSSAPNQADVFLGDVAGPCEVCRLQTGQTLFIPSGWIHAVYTPADTIVIGGNFVHALGIPMQLAVEQIEEATQVPLRYRFPFFRHVLWHYANSVGQGTLPPSLHSRRVRSPPPRRSKASNYARSKHARREVAWLALTSCPSVFPRSRAHPTALCVLSFSSRALAVGQHARGDGPFAARAGRTACAVAVPGRPSGDRCAWPRGPVALAGQRPVRPQDCACGPGTAPAPRGYRCDRGCVHVHPGRRGSRA